MVRELEDMQSVTDEAFRVLTDGNSSLDIFGELLGHQWNIKRSLTKHISNPDIDGVYRLGIQNGALGGKLLGAGGGGFMLFYAPKEKHKAIANSLGTKLFVPFRFEDTGSKIVYYSHE